MGEIKKYDNTIFDNLRNINEYGQEFWYARELKDALEYARWENFVNVIRKAMIACSKSGNPIKEHFREVTKVFTGGQGAKLPGLDYELSRYACYLIVMNGDPKKEIIALGQTYFAVRTRRDEIRQEEYDRLSEDEKRMYLREQMRNGTMQLNKAAQDAQVRNFGHFTDAGYLGLYGMRAADIRQRKGISPQDNPMDYAGSEELATNIFRASQTAAKLKRENIQGQAPAEDAHYTVGRKIRNLIDEMGNTLPENLPTPPESNRNLESSQPD